MSRRLYQRRDKKANKALHPTGAEFSIYFGWERDSLLPGFGDVHSPAAVAQVLG